MTRQHISVNVNGTESEPGSRLPGAGAGAGAGSFTGG